MKTHPRSRLFVAFGAVALLFLGSTALATWFSYEIEERYESLSWNALPSIVRLTAGCDALRDLEATSDDYPDVDDDRRVALRKTIDQEWHALDGELEAYLEFPAYPGERELFESGVPAALRDVNTALGHLFAQVEAHQVEAARVTADREVGAAANRAARLLRAMVSFNATHARDDLERIAAVHRRASHRAMLLDGLALLGTVVVALWVLRRFRDHDALVADHSALLGQRAAELEMFGQRVAHDLLSPLSALTYCLGAFKKASESDPKLEEALSRARGCVSRAQGMVHGIFDFALAGGQPEPGAHTDLREVVDHVIEEVRTAEVAERVDVTIEPFETCQVACAPGVLTSVLSNLVRNAVKYMSDSALKRITVRVREKASSVCVEVEDTGPGIPRGLEHRIFEPYIRAEGVTQPGLGLGLATVKRLCEAYGGSVGVRSKVGQGSVFWFSLPHASGAIESVPRVSSATIRRVS